MEDKKCLTCKFFKSTYSHCKTIVRAGECMKNTMQVINSRTGNLVFRKLSVYSYNLCQYWDLKTEDETIKSCTHCGIPKNINEFSPTKTGSIPSDCKLCVSIINKKRAKDNPEKYKSIQLKASKKYQQKKKANHLISEFAPLL